MTAHMGTTLLVAVIGGIVAFDHRSSLRLLISQPICGGLLTGLVLGDWRAGFLAGAVLQMMFLGTVPVRGAPLPDLPLGGVVSAALCVLVPRAIGGDPSARGLVLALSIAAGLVAAVVGRAAYRWWEGQADALADAAGRAVEKDRWWAPPLFHVSTVAVHFAFGFAVAGGAAAIGVPAGAAFVRSVAGDWCEPLGSLDVLLPFIGAGALLLMNLTKVRIFLYAAGFACVFLVFFFKG
jgi:mannose/fructose/N-acetylgalactosamine-specific phosphotransferase system component IIC